MGGDLRDRFGFGRSPIVARAEEIQESIVMEHASAGTVDVRKCMITDVDL